MIKNRQDYTDKVLYWYAFFMAFPSFQIVFKLNFYIFPFLVGLFLRRSGYFIKYISFIQVFAFAFGIGSILSTINSTNINASASVLINYIYWSLVIIFFISHGRMLNFYIIFRALSHGLIASIIYYFVFQKIFILALPFNKGLPQNAIAFLMICFSPILVYYIKITKKNIWSFFTAILMVILAFLTGSRSGSVLVLIGSFFAYFIEKVSFSKGIPILILSIVFIGILEMTGISRFVVKILNEETYELIYNPSEVFQKDISYLTRVAMREKGMNMYEEHKAYGVGLNLFKDFEAPIEGMPEWKRIFNFSELTTGIGAHNSYISILAEGGLVCFIPFILILGAMILTFIINYSILPDFTKVAGIGVIAMCIHLYFVSAILNVFTWFNIAITASLLLHSRKSQIAQHFQ